MSSAAEKRSFAAAGIGVSDLDRSVDFYTRVLGMTKMQTFSLPHMEEVVVGYPGSAAVVLMHYTDGSSPNYRDNPVKLVFKVGDAAALAEAIRADGCAIQSEAAPFEELKTVVVLASDPDGYTVELLSPMT